MELRTGQILEGRYQIQKHLGRGGNSCVYLAYDTADGKLRALKEIRKSGDSCFSGGARREAETVQRLRYPYFPEIFDILESEEADYIVMEYLQGETAGERLRRLGPQPAEEVMRWAKDLCLMLSYLHCRTPSVVYCDMKPDNIMIQSGEILRLIDFGAAAEGQGKGRLLLGTRGYAAPEQFDGGRPVDARTDIYGLGVTVLQLLTGIDPNKADGGAFVQSIRKIRPRRLRQIIIKCTNREPEGRYGSCAELRADLKRL